MEYLYETSERFYFVMPFIGGGLLGKVLEHERKFSEDRMRFYITQIVITIGKLHQNFIMHRNIRMSNILLDEQGYLKLIDYGSVCIIRE